ncbi:hypothetical protein ACLHDG_05605 [Sulfurovum sp. CS9]|uniref:hypothetical protein n=1 Tax=Sulfurovum sp. CS9 TaxID=3391146 RepID=UPI0039EA5A6D
MKNKNIFLVKFAVVAAMIGFFSPSVSVKTNVPSGNGFAAMPIEMNVSLFTQAEARRGGGGARRGGSANRSRSSNRNRNTNKNRNTNRNVNKNVNRNVNRNVNKNVNVNVNNNRRYYGGHSRGYYGYYRGAPLMAFTTGLVIGSVIAASTMPTTCTTVVANGVSYRRCDNSYYQPFYEGDTLVYKVVSSPY